MQINQISSGKNKNFRINHKSQIISLQKDKIRTQSQESKQNNVNFGVKYDDCYPNHEKQNKTKRKLSIIDILNHPKALNINKEQSKVVQMVKKQSLSLNSKERRTSIYNAIIDQKGNNKFSNNGKRSLIIKQSRIKQNEASNQNIFQQRSPNENILFILQNEYKMKNKRKDQQNQSQKEDKLQYDGQILTNIGQKLIYKGKKLVQQKIPQQKSQKIKVQQNRIIKYQSISNFNLNCLNSNSKNKSYIKKIKKQTQWNQFSISIQFSFKIDSQTKSIQTTEIGVQSQNSFSTYQDKYFHQYVRYRELKLKHYHQVQQKQEKIKKLIAESLEFVNHYNLFKEISNGIPDTDREKRVYALGKEIEEAERVVKQAVERVNKVQIQSEKYLCKIIPSIQNKKNQLFLSITNLTRAFQIERKNSENEEEKKKNKEGKTFQEVKKQKTYFNILGRVLNQFKYLKQLDIKEYENIISILTEYQSEVKKFQKSYVVWSGLYYQSRVLIYNFLRQIQKIPEIMIQLFGLKTPEEIYGNLSPEKKFDEYMSTKCEQCYHTNKKVKFLESTIHQIKPIMKSLEYLIRDMSKKKSCISII